MAKLLYQGHGSLRICSSNNEILYLDPFIGEGYDLPANYVLITHEHYDHNQVNRVHMKKDTIILRPKDMLINGQYQKKRIGSFIIEAVPAYNKNHQKDECVGYLIEVDGVLIYVSGDTSFIEEMKDLKDRKIDYAFFPTDGIYNMDALEASKCAKIVHATYSVPIHSKPDHLYDEEVVKDFTYEGALFIKPGQEIELVKGK